MILLLPNSYYLIIHNNIYRIIKTNDKDRFSFEYYRTKELVYVKDEPNGPYPCSLFNKNAILEIVEKIDNLENYIVSEKLENKIDNLLKIIEKHEQNKLG